MCSVEASHVSLGMHLEKVMLVQQALETEEQVAKRRKTRALETKEQTATCTSEYGIRGTPPGNPGYVPCPYTHIVAVLTMPIHTYCSSIDHACTYVL